MLAVQRYLKRHPFESLTAEFAISVKRHDFEPLVILNYHQIDSPKLHPVVRECRGLVLHEETKAVVARGFERFFNWGEDPETEKQFQWGRATAQEKIDGSLILIYHWNGQWRANTRNTFGNLPMGPGWPTWTEAVDQACGGLQDLGKHFRRGFTYVCELTSPWNKVIQEFDRPRLWLLTSFENVTGREFHEEAKGFWEAVGTRLAMPLDFVFRGIEETREHVEEVSQAIPTFEGVVIRDYTGRRVKVKSAKYLALHRLKGNGNLLLTKNLLPFVLAGESDELIASFPEASYPIGQIEGACAMWKSQLELLWTNYRDLPAQKEFALAIKDHPLAAVLFDMRKRTPEAKAKVVWEAMQRHEPLLLRHLREGFTVVAASGRAEE